MNILMIQVNPGSVTMTKGDWYYGLSVKIEPLEADCKCVRWSSSNSNVVSINASTGYMYAVGAGTATITATATDGSNVKGSCKVTVAPRATNISLSKNDEYLYVGQNITIKATLTPNSPIAPLETVSWSSSNPLVATVNSSGIVFGHSAGTTKITATVNGFHKSITVKVINNKVVVCKDRNSFFEHNHNKIVFYGKNNSIYKEWYCVNDDVWTICSDVSEGNLLYDDIRNERKHRACLNYYAEYILESAENPNEDPLDRYFYQGRGVRTYTIPELKVIYAIDPLGVQAYVQQYAPQKAETDAGGRRAFNDLTTNEQHKRIVAIKDSFYYDLFGSTAKHYKRIDTNNWVEDTSTNPNMDITVSESEFVFGIHKICGAATIDAIVSFVVDCFVSIIDVILDVVGKIYKWKEVKAHDVFKTVALGMLSAKLKGETVSFKTAITDVTITLIDNDKLGWANTLIALYDSWQNIENTMNDRPEFKEFVAYCADDTKEIFKMYPIYFRFGSETYATAEMLEKFHN